MLSFRARGRYYKVGGGGGADFCTQLSCIAPPCMEGKLFIETGVKIQAKCTILHIIYQNVAFDYHF